MYYKQLMKRPACHRENEWRIGLYNENGNAVVLYRGYLNRKYFYWTLYPETEYIRMLDAAGKSLYFRKMKISGYDVKRERAEDEVQ